MRKVVDACVTVLVVAVAISVFVKVVMVPTANVDVAAALNGGASDDDSSATQERIAKLGNVIGPAEPVVTIVEFGDFACGFCREFDGTVRRVLKKYPDLVSLRWVNYTSKRGMSRDVAVAAECAAQQGKFAAFHSYVFSPAGLAFKRSSQLVAAAAEVGVPDTLLFKACTSAPAVKARIDAETALGRELKIKGTPAWFINGRAGFGAVREAVFDSVIVAEIVRSRQRG